MDLLHFAGVLIASAGGTAVVLAGLAGWLGKVWADRISQEHKEMGPEAARAVSKRVAAIAAKRSTRCGGLLQAGCCRPRVRPDR